MPHSPTPLLRSVDWDALDRLRRAFLDGTAGHADYWGSDRDLELYDRTFGQRIAWKWQSVFRELSRLGWQAPEGAVLDWGCGSGVAGREFLRAWGAGPTRQLLAWDRSARAREYTVRRTRTEFPGVRATETTTDHPAVLLLSHVLTELNDPTLENVLHLASRSGCVLWVEPGTREASRRLIAIRERLRCDFSVIAPCPHQKVCGLLAPGNQHHWCHHFASSPPQVFTENHWTRFGQLTGIDLRSLPLSYLVLDRRPPSPLPADTVRFLGRPRVYKAFARLLGCAAQGALERELHRRRLPDAFRQAKKDRLDTLQRWLHDDRAITALQAVFEKSDSRRDSETTEPDMREP